MNTSNEKLDAFYAGLRGNPQGPSDMTSVYAFFLIAAAIILALVAITHWKKVRKSDTKKIGRARSLAHHGKLLKEIAKGSGIPTKQLKAIMPLTQSLGASSPLVALLCPSLLKRLADQTPDGQGRDALAQVARKLVEQDGT